MDLIDYMIFSSDPSARFQHEKVYGAQKGSADDQALRALMFAVLEDAVACFQSANAKLVQEAEEWIRSNDDSVFSFSNICETLGLDPNRLRKGLEQWKAKRTGIPPDERKHRILSKGKRPGKKRKAA